MKYKTHWRSGTKEVGYARLPPEIVAVYKQIEILFKQGFDATRMARETGRERTFIHGAMDRMRRRKILPPLKRTMYPIDALLTKDREEFVRLLGLNTRAEDIAKQFNIASTTVRAAARRLREQEAANQQNESDPNAISLSAGYGEVLEWWKVDAGRRLERRPSRCHAVQGTDEHGALYCASKIYRGKFCAVHAMMYYREPIVSATPGSSTQKQRVSCSAS